LSTYQINDLERLTGIKAHTLRIWEKRYNIISPHRTATNIRYYDDEQVRKLLNVATLLEQGYKISEIAKLKESDIKDHIRNVNQEAPDNGVIALLVNDLVAATISFDETYFEKAFSSAVTRFGMYKTMVSLMYPFLNKVGILWSINNIESTQEHFATCIVRRKLLAAIDGLPPSKKSDKKFLLFLPTDEWHEIALLFSDYIIRSLGYTTIYLGPNLPHDIALHAIKETEATHLLTFYIARRDDADIKKDIDGLVKKYPKLEVLISGSPALLSNIKFPKNAILLKSPEDLQKRL
jgi:DNA-binding transcriptional MerR regulator